MSRLHTMRYLPLALAVLHFSPRETASQQPPVRTSDMFARYADRVMKIQVVERESGAKAFIGSAFFVNAAGNVVTNYHVISSIVNRPTHYRAELMGTTGNTFAAEVVAIDVINDLAILKTDARGHPFFKLEVVQPTSGQRLFSIGNPHDLGMSIIEGTYNGLLQNTLYPRIHLTAAINPGMSGGPTIDEAGRVIGVNVSSAGNEISFLVPVQQAVTLLQHALTSPNAVTPTVAVVAAQLREHQDSYLREMFGSSARLMDFGPFRVVTQPAPFFHCWGDALHDQNKPFQRTRHRCDTEHDVFLDDDQRTGFLSVEHELITNKTLTTSGFFSAYTALLEHDNSPEGAEEYVTNWKCTVRNVGIDTTRMRAVMCIRRYRKYGELYDANLKLALLGTKNVGLVSTLNATGLSFDNLTRVSERFMGMVKWR